MQQFHDNYHVRVISLNDSGSEEFMNVATSFANVFIIFYYYLLYFIILFLARNPSWNQNWHQYIKFRRIRMITGWAVAINHFENGGCTPSWILEIWCVGHVTSVWAWSCFTVSEMSAISVENRQIFLPPCIYRPRWSGSPWNLVSA